MLFRFKYYLGALFTKRTAPRVDANTFFVWEPCTHSHAEVVPGYVKYLLDLGFNVSVLLTPRRLDEGLFSRFDDPRITLNRMSQAAILHHFRKNGLGEAKGILITTARKIGRKDSYRSEYSLFERRRPEQKVLLVEHDVRRAVDADFLGDDTLTLRKIDYKGARTCAVNPHYFGAVRLTTKNEGVTHFITIGALRARRRNTALLIEAAEQLHTQGVDRYKITVIGRGTLRGIPAHLRQHFDIKGRVDFATLYSEVERADFFLMLLDPDNPAHERYLTTATSGNVQLIYGFAKPCLIAAPFAHVHGFNEQNALVYTHNAELAAHMHAAISMTADEYHTMQQAVKRLADSVYAESLANLTTLIAPTI